MQSQIAFQLFPLANLPLLFRRPTSAPTAPAPAAEEGLTAAKMMGQMAFQSAGMWIAGAYFARPALRQLLDISTWKNLTLQGDIESLFFWDVLGSAFTLLAIVIIDSIVDAYQPKQVGGKPVHEELTLQDVGRPVLPVRCRDPDNNNLSLLTGTLCDPHARCVRPWLDFLPICETS